MKPEAINAFTFLVKAHNDVHIALSSVDADNPEIVEVVLGGSFNTESWIAEGIQGTSTSKMLYCTVLYCITVCFSDIFSM